MIGTFAGALESEGHFYADAANEDDKNSLLQFLRTAHITAGSEFNPLIQVPPSRARQWRRER
jgi:hypothetical protein